MIVAICIETDSNCAGRKLIFCFSAHFPVEKETKIRRSLEKYTLLETGGRLETKSAQNTKLYVT